MQTAFRIYPAQTSAVLLYLLKDALSYLDFNKTITKDRDIIDAVTYLREEFPVMKVEEWVIITQRMKSGEYHIGYERLKLPELRDIFCRYEESRAEMREGNWQEAKKVAQPVLNDEKLLKLYQETKIRLDAEKKERDEREKIKRVETDAQGRWSHIPYPNDTESDTNQET